MPKKIDDGKSNNLNPREENDLFESVSRFVDKHEYQKAKHLLEKLLVSVRSENANSKNEKDRIRLMHVLTSLAAINLNLNSRKEAERYFEEGLRIWNELPADTQTLRPKIIFQFAGFCNVTGDYGKAEMLSKRLLKVLEQSKETARLPAVFNLLHETYSWAGRRDLATQMALKELKVRESLYGKNNPELIDILWSLEVLYNGKPETSMYRKRRETLMCIGIQRNYVPCLLIEAQQISYVPSKAIPLYEKVLRLQKVKGADRAAIAKTSAELGFCYCRAGKWQQAREPISQAVSLYESRYNPADFLVLEQLILLSRIEYALGNRAECVNLLTRVLKTQKAAGSTFFGHVGNRIAVDADFYGVKYKDKHEPENYLKLAISLQQHILGANHKDLIDTFEELSSICAENNNLKEGDEYLKQALKVVEQADPKQKSSVLFGYGSALKRAGQFRLAKVYRAKADECRRNEKNSAKR